MCFCWMEALAMEKIGRISEEVCTEIAERVCESSFRNSAEILSEEMAVLSISHETVWNVTQKMGERKLKKATTKANVGRTEERNRYCGNRNSV